jgi:two-component system chemotaxis response regulator CheY
MDKTINVLIVDDYRTMLRIIRNLLKQLDFNNVEEATDGTEALAKLRAGNFGLVISDWNMQPMTGLDLLREVRADARLKQTPFIMITAEKDGERDRGEAGRRLELHRQAVQRRDAAREDREGAGPCVTERPFRAAPTDRRRPTRRSRRRYAPCSPAWPAT